MNRIALLFLLLTACSAVTSPVHAQDWQTPYEGSTDEEIQGYLAEPDPGDEDLEQFDQELQSEEEMEGYPEGFPYEEPYPPEGQPDERYPGEFDFPEENVEGFDQQPFPEAPLQELPPDFQTGA